MVAVSAGARLYYPTILCLPPGRPAWPAYLPCLPPLPTYRLRAQHPPLTAHHAFTALPATSSTHISLRDERTPRHCLYAALPHFSRAEMSSANSRMPLQTACVTHNDWHCACCSLPYLCLPRALQTYLKPHGNTRRKEEGLLTRTPYTLTMHTPERDTPHLLNTSLLPLPFWTGSLLPAHSRGRKRPSIPSTPDPLPNHDFLDINNASPSSRDSALSPMPLHKPHQH